MVKETGGLSHDGDKLNFLGRELTRDGEAIHFISLKEYLTDIVEQMKLQTCRVSTTTGTNLVRKMDDFDSPLEPADHKLYRSFAGKRAWASPIRPDLAYAIKELARHGRE